MPAEPDERILLAADVGGTNLGLALVALRKGRFELLARHQGRTREATSLLEPIRGFLDEMRKTRGLVPEAVGLSGAGPVRGRTIALTNAPWAIEGDDLERELDLPVTVMNDFTAVAHGVLLLDPRDETQLLPLGPGSPDARGTMLLVGAGTGLGVGAILRGEGPPRICPSEGGHIGLPVFDEETLDLWRFLRERFPGPPGAETAVSGPGLCALLSFLLETGRCRPTPLNGAILAHPEETRAAAIARHQDEDPACGRALDLFVDLYARVCADLAAVFLPTGGLYLAGGIAAKNASRFLAGRRFLDRFQSNYREHVDELTRATPVFIVRDYAISLLGAASLASRSLPG